MVVQDQLYSMEKGPLKRRWCACSQIITPDGNKAVAIQFGQTFISMVQGLSANKGGWGLYIKLPSGFYECSLFRISARLPLLHQCLAIEAAGISWVSKWHAGCKEAK